MSDHRCDCESLFCFETSAHEPGECPGAGAILVRVCGFEERLCPACLEWVKRSASASLEILEKGGAS